MVCFLIFEDLPLAPDFALVPCLRDHSFDFVLSFISKQVPDFSSCTPTSRMAL